MKTLKGSQQQRAIKKRRRKAFKRKWEKGQEKKVNLCGKNTKCEDEEFTNSDNRSHNITLSVKYWVHIKKGNEETKGVRETYKKTRFLCRITSSNAQRSAQYVQKKVQHEIRSHRFLILECWRCIHTTTGCIISGTSRFSRWVNSINYIYTRERKKQTISR